MIKRYSKKEIDSLIKILKSGGILCVPTDTVFGLCGSIASHGAYERLREVKDRPLGKAFPVMCSNLEQVKRIATVTEKDERIINKFMPGPLTEY